MATTAFNSAGLAMLRGGTDKFARPMFFGQLAALSARLRTNKEKRVLARFAGNRWCDSTERQILDALGESGRATHWF